jgi:hypothetical protein
MAGGQKVGLDQIKRLHEMLDSQGL